MNDGSEPAAHGRGDASDLPFAAGLAFLAGATDVCGLAHLHDVFVSFMSGNTTLLGVAIGQGDWPRVGLILGVVGLFVAGSAVGAVLEFVAGRRHEAAVALVVAALLALPLLRPDWTTPALVLAMGILNAALTRVGAASVSLTYVTGTLVKLGQGLGRALCGRPGDGSWLLQAPMWLSLLAGAAAAATLAHRTGSPVTWPLPALALALALAALARGGSRGKSGGTSGGTSGRARA